MFKKFFYTFIIVVITLTVAACKHDENTEINKADVIPTKLSDRHELNNFEAYENSDNLTVVHAYGLEPYVSFKVIIGANIKINNYDYKTNDGIKYNIDLLEDGMYQAY